MRKATLITILSLLLTFALPCEDVHARQAQEKAKTTAASKTTKGNGNSKATGKNNKSGTANKSVNSKGGKSTTPAKGGKKSAKGNKKTETSADLRKQQESTQQEIRETRRQLQENDAAVKKNLSELGKLEGDIADGKKKVAAASGKVATLNRQISTLEAKIAAEEKSLAKMRGEYLKAVKQMRTKSKGKSTLAFIFSSKSFNEALRRMRYLKRFSAWRDKQSKEISRRVGELRKQTDLLARTKTEQDKALAAEVKAQNELQTQYNRQDAIVVELKKNGAALSSHLAKKQAEVNALKSRVAALIAEETRKAEAERQAQARAEAERKAKAEAARVEAERKQAEEERQKSEADRKAREELTAENNAKKTESEKSKAAPEKKEKKSETAKPVKKTPKKEEKKAAPAEPKKSGDVTYAEARRRRPKDKKSAAPSAAPAKSTAPAKADAPAKTPAKAATTNGGGSFESMKGALPKPVAGSFKVTSRFGTHSLPDMPNVTYDNPGIDAEVTKGAAAQAVYAGKVSGVYMIPGYNTVVIVNHGNYYTVYGNIQASAVKVGDSVKQGQSLGRLAPDDEDGSHSTIHFEVWKNRDKLDPLGWIR